MQRRQIVMAGVVAALLAVLFIGFQSGGDDKSTSSSGQPPLMTIQVDKDGKPIGGILDTEYTTGQHIRIKVTSAIAGEVHFHGYDVMEEITEPGGSVTFDVPADQEGVFEMEMEEQHSAIAQITVDPG